MSRLAAPLLLSLGLCGCRTKPSSQGDDSGLPTTSSDPCTPDQEQAFYADADADGWGDATAPVLACDAPTGFVSDATDCDDTDAEVGPPVSGWLDRDLDGWGAASLTTCTPPAALAEQGGDCDDLDEGIHPGAVELCDEVDQDCDETVDEDPVDGSTWYGDEDGDGWGDDATAVVACASPADAVSDGGDCAPADPAIHPLAAEVCDNEVDEDCNGRVDNTCQVTWTVQDAAWLTLSGGDEDLGEAVALGDLDGDGTVDLVAADPDATSPSGETDAGAIHVVHGPASGQVEVGSAGVSTIEHVGPTPGSDRLGYRLAVLPDLDGDGYPDLLTSLYATSADDDTTHYDNQGHVRLFSGPLTGGVSSADAVAFITSTGGEQVLDTVRFASGDLDGDGQADLVLGAMDGGDSAEGRAWVFRGPVDGDRVVEEADVTLQDDLVNSRLGTATVVADLDGDGQDDLLLGAFYRDLRGAVFAFQGPLSGALDVDDADWRMDGEDLAFIGAHLAVGDVDGDGAGDLVRASFSSYDPTAGYRPEAQAHTLSATGPEAEPFWAFHGPSDDTIGALVLPDLDGDGVQDVVLGLPETEENAGRVAGYLGPLAGTLELSQADLLLQGQADDYLGDDLAAAVDGEGVWWLALGARGYGSDGGAGRAYLLSAEAL